MCLSTRDSLESCGPAFGTLFHWFGNLVVERDDLEKAFETFLEEFWLHVLVPSPEEEVDFDTVAFLEPLRGALGLELLVVFASSYLHLDALGLSTVALGLYLTCLAASLVTVLPVVHDLGYWGLGIWGDLDEVELSFFGGLDCICERKGTKILTIGGDHPEFG